MNRKSSKTLKSVPVNITLTPLLYQKLRELVVARGFNGPSDFFQETIRLNAGLGLVPNEEKGP